MDRNMLQTESASNKGNKKKNASNLKHEGTGLLMKQQLSSIISKLA